MKIYNYHSCFEYIKSIKRGGTASKESNTAFLCRGKMLNQTLPPGGADYSVKGVTGRAPAVYPVRRCNVKGGGIRIVHSSENTDVVRQTSQRVG